MTQRERPQLAVLVRPKAAGAGSATLDRCERAAMSAALWLKGRHGAQVSAITAGPLAATRRVLELALRAGCDRGVQLAVPDPASTDYLGIARVIAAHFHSSAADVVLCGARSESDRVGALGPAVAELCAMPHLGHVVGIDTDAQDPGAVWTALTATQRLGGQLHRFRCTGPMVLCVESFAAPSPIRDAGPAHSEGKSKGPGRSNDRLQTRALDELQIPPTQLSVRGDFIGVVSAGTRTSATTVSDPAALLARLHEDRLLDP